MKDLTKDKIASLIGSSDQFPVDFDLAWEWVGYSRSDSALRMLKGNFEDGIDFSTIMRKNPKRGRPVQNIRLSVDCFKSFCMMAGTNKGREVRQYFLKVEREYQTVKRALNPLPEHVRREVQVKNSKRINAINVENGGPGKAINYNRRNCLTHTGYYPSELVDKAAKL